jgi:hypothetical protein
MQLAYLLTCGWCVTQEPWRRTTLKVSGKLLKQGVVSRLRPFELAGLTKFGWRGIPLAALNLQYNIKKPGA